MTHQLFSDAALKCFENFLRVDRATSHLRPRGAVDALTPELRRALARDQKMTPFTPALKPMSGVRGGDNGERLDFKSAGAMTPQARRRQEEAAKREKEWAEERAKAGENEPDEGASDEGEMPDRDAIRAAVECIREAMGDEAAAEFVSALHDKWPGIYGQWNGGEGEEIVGDVPGPTPGTPRPGGGNWPYEEKDEHLAGDAAMAYDQRFPGVRARVGIEPDYRPTDSISAYDNWGRPTGARPIARNSRSGRHTRSEASMALDARSEHSYAMVFPDAMKIGLL